MKLSGTDIAQTGYSKFSQTVKCPWCEQPTTMDLGVQHRVGSISLHCPKCTRFSMHKVADAWFDSHIQKERDLKEVWKKIPSDAFLTCRQSVRNTPFVYTLYLGDAQRPEEFFSRDTVQYTLMKEFGMSEKQADGALISAALTPGKKVFLQQHTRLVMAAEEREQMKKRGVSPQPIGSGTPIRYNGLNGLFLRYSANDGFAIVALPAKNDEFGDAEVPVVDLEVVDAGGPEVLEDFEMDKAEGEEEAEASALEEALDHIDEAEDIIEDIVLHEESEEDFEMDEGDEEEDEEEEKEAPPFEASRRAVGPSGSTVERLKTLRSIIDDPQTDPKSLQEAQKEWVLLKQRTASKDAQRRVHVHYTHSGNLKRAIEANRQELSIEDIRDLTKFYANTGKIAHNEADEIADFFIGGKPRLLCAADERTAQGIEEIAHEGEGKICGECGSSTSQCTKCGKEYLLGHVAYCPEDEEPVECSGCAQIVSEDLDGVTDLDGNLIPWGTERFEDFDLETFFGEGKESAVEEDEYTVNPDCPACGGAGNPLGQLGKLFHYRCRNCGIDFSHQEERTSARHKDGCECGFCQRMRENQEWKKNRGKGEPKEAQSLRCQECGRKVPKGRYSCPKCGSEDVDVDVSSHKPKTWPKQKPALSEKDLRTVTALIPGLITEDRPRMDAPQSRCPQCGRKTSGGRCTSCNYDLSKPQHMRPFVGENTLTSKELVKEGCGIGIFTPAVYDGADVLVIAIDNTSLQATVQDGEGKQKVVDLADLKPAKKGPFTGNPTDKE